MEDQNIAVGQEFPDVKTFRRTIKELAIAQHFELRIIKSDLVRYFAKCAKEGCPWRIRAVKLPHAPTFTIRSLEGVHTCGRTAQLGHHQASIDWIANFIEERLRDNVNYKPRDILEDIHKQYGITIPYKQAWRAKERGLAAIYGSSEEGYCLIPAYCDQIKRTNPGSVAQVFTKSDHRFQSLFVAFHASIFGFANGCLPLLGVGSLQLKSKYLGALLSATSFDGDGDLFPLAFGVVDVETDESWVWFLSEIHKILEMRPNLLPRLTILSDGRNEIVNAVKRKFPTTAQGSCMRHLSEQISEKFKNSRLVQLLWKAAQSITKTGFKERMAEIRDLSGDAAQWIQKIPPSSWATAYFEGDRYGQFSSNSKEFNSWILDACELPIIQVIEQVHNKLRNEFNARRERAMSWNTVLVPSAEKRLSEAISDATGHQVLRSDHVEFEVITGDRSHIVNIGTRSCSCGDWQVYGLPCSHGVAALLFSRMDVYEFCDEHFLATKYQEAYSQIIYPTPDKSQWGNASIVSCDATSRIVRPSKFRRLPGRPEKKRQCMEERSEKHTVRCSRCNRTGHYKSTCKAETVKH